MMGAAFGAPVASTLLGRGLRHITWPRFLVMGVLAAVATVQVPGIPGVLLLNGVQVVGACAMLLGARRHWRRAGRPWQLIACGFLLAVLADAAWTTLPGSRANQTLLGVLGTLFLAKQLLLATGLAVMVSRDTARWWWEATLDGVIAAAGVAVVLWVVAARPIIHNGQFGRVATAAAVAYIALDLLVLCVLARLVFVSGVRSPAGLLTAAAVGALLLADARYCVTLASPHPYSAAGLSLLGWMSAAMLLGTAALHPTVRDLGRPSRQALAGASRARMGTFVVLAVLGPIVATGVQVFGYAGQRRWTWTDDLIPAVLTTALSVLLVLRLGLLLKLAHDRARALQGSLRAQERLQHQLSHRALHDPLTGLGNRSLLHERLERSLSTPNPAFVLLMLDLDGFKDVNDSLGHPVGDELLIEVAGRLATAISDTDALVRLGGDEFAILLTSADLSEATRLARWVLDTVKAPYLLAGREVYLTTSIGLLAHRGDRLTSSDALRDADLALYAAKAAGKNRVVVFDAGLRRAQAERARLSDGLRRPDVYDELTLRYQPIVELPACRTYGLEALLRWQPPGGRSVPPSDFVPVAEQTGLIVPIGRWVVERAIRDVRPWYERYGVAVTVNVSALQLRDQDFADEVLDVLARHDVPGDALIIELTESVIIGDNRLDAVVVEASLNRLRHRGIRVALDDFGTGYSSLSNLCQLPVDVLKIDHLFTRHLIDGAADARRIALIQAVLDVGRNLHLRTVAEGIETEEQAGRLSAMGCPLAQGYLFSPPLSAAEVPDYLAAPPARRDWLPCPAPTH